MKTTAKRLSALLLTLLLLSGLAGPAEAKSKKKKTPTPRPQVTATPTPTKGKDKDKKKKTPTPQPETTAAPVEMKEPDAVIVTEDGEYTDRDHVAAYLRAFGHLPSNYITKREAQDLGWSGNGGESIWKYAPGKSIGGSRVGNYEGQLPEQNGRRWYECDIDYDGRNRGTKRIIYSSDGLIYYTEDHYNTFIDITEPETRAGP